MSSFPKSVRVVEVGPRDGLQNESAILDTFEKLHYISLLSETGLTDVEATSFVSPQWVPQLGDSEQIFEHLDQDAGIRYSALVPNLKGLERAQSCGVRNIAIFTAASDTFTRRNIGMTREESLASYREVTAQAKQAGMWVRGYVSTAFYCPFEGKISGDSVVAVTEELLQMGVDEVSIGDTIGHAVPTEVTELTKKLRGE